jgi:hypothetical protein
MLIQLGGLIAMCQLSLAQGTWVDCPGKEERVICGEDQVAICWVSEDSSYERCLTPPGNLADRSLDIWLLSYVLDDTITVTDESIHAYQDIIKKRVWEGKTYKVAFSLPGSWKGTH